MDRTRVEDSFLIRVVRERPVGKEFILRCASIRRMRLCEAIAYYPGDGRISLRRVYSADFFAEGIALVRTEGDWINIPIPSEVIPGLGYRLLSSKGLFNWHIRSRQEMARHTDVWEFWDRRYETKMVDFGVEANSNISRWLQLNHGHLKSGRVLVLGAGYGRDIRPLNVSGIESVGIELSSYASGLGQDLLNEPSLKVQGDALRWLDSHNLAGAFSGVISVHASESHAVESLLADAACKTLASGGAVLYVANSCKFSPERVMQEWSDVVWHSDIQWESPETFALQGHRI